MEDPVWKSLIIVTFVSVTVHIMEITVIKVKSSITLLLMMGNILPT